MAGTLTHVCTYGDAGSTRPREQRWEHKRGHTEGTDNGLAGRHPLDSSRLDAFSEVNGRGAPTPSMSNARPTHTQQQSERQSGGLKNEDPPYQRYLRYVAMAGASRTQPAFKRMKRQSVIPSPQSQTLRTAPSSRRASVRRLHLGSHGHVELADTLCSERRRKFREFTSSGRTRARTLRRSFASTSPGHLLTFVIGLSFG